MIIKNTPFSVRYCYRIIWSWIRFFFQITIKKNQPHRGKLNFLYFSYEPDYQYLYLSIQSIIKHTQTDMVGKVFLIEDQKAPFSKEQLQSLKTLCPTLHVLPIYNFAWGSALSTYEELQMFLKVSDLMDNEWDLLLKIDSDVLIFNAKKLEIICQSTIEAIGDGHFLQFKYAQGGLYMLRKHLIQKMFKTTTVEQIDAINKLTGSVGEDKAISHLLNKQDKSFFFTRLMLFPDEYNNIEHLNNVQKEFVALHCHKDKEQMQNLSDKFGIL